jgi:hypothetical protein
VPLWSALMLVLATPIAAQESATSNPSTPSEQASDQAVSPDAQAVLDKMTAYLRGLHTFSISGDSTRDEVVDYGYKLQDNEHSELIAQRPSKLRAEVSGDIRNRDFVYDGSKLVIYSPDDHVYTRVDAPDNIAGLVGRAMDAGVEMPMVDVLYEAAEGTLTDAVRSGVLVGTSTIEGVECDQLAFRQDDIDWQLWVERGAHPLPRKIVITTRYEVGDPQFQVVLNWNLKPKINKSTFVFTPPKGVSEIPFSEPVALQSGTQ